MRLTPSKPQKNDFHFFSYNLFRLQRKSALQLAILVAVPSMHQPESHQPELLLSAVREVKDLRRTESLQVFNFIRLFDEVRAEIFRDIEKITSISLIYSLTFLRKSELLFWLSQGLNQLTCVTPHIKGDYKLRDQPIALLRPRVVHDMKNSYKFRTRLGVQVCDFSTCFSYFTK